MLPRCVKQFSHTILVHVGRGDVPIQSNETFHGRDGQNAELAVGENASVKIEGEGVRAAIFTSLKLLDARSSNLFQLRA